jgi:hypothetical protein
MSETEKENVLADFETWAFLAKMSILSLCLYLEFLSSMILLMEGTEMTARTYSWKKLKLSSVNKLFPVSPPSRRQRW